MSRQPSKRTAKVEANPNSPSKRLKDSNPSEGVKMSPNQAKTAKGVNRELKLSARRRLNFQPQSIPEIHQELSQVQDLMASGSADQADQQQDGPTGHYDLKQVGCKADKRDGQPKTEKSVDRKK